MSYQTAETKELDMQIGMRLREFRIARGLSQASVGEALGLTFQQIQKYEKGMNRVSGSRMVALCQLLDITPDQLTGIDAKPSPITGMSTSAIRVAHKYDQLDSEQKRAVSTIINTFLGENDEVDG